MTDNASNATVTTIEHGDPSPVPENNWLWRRLYVFVVTALLCFHVFWTARGVTDVGTLREVIRNDQGLIMLYALLYLAGASAEAIATIFAAIRTSVKQTITSAPPTGTATSTSTPSVTTAQATTAPASPVAPKPTVAPWLR